MNLRVLRENRNLWLITCFSIYLFFFFIFAGIYYSIFRANPRNFLFNSDVAKSQSSIFTRPIENEISTLKDSLDQYRALLEKLNQSNMSQEIGNPELDIKKIEFLVGTGSSSSGNAEFFLLPIPGTSPHNFNILELPSGTKPSDRVEIIRDFLGKIISEHESLLTEKQILLLNLQSPNAQIWSYWDFYYFSVITQTTVGYGDILPNSTLVRMVVSLQLIIGLMILTILISLSFRRRKVGTTTPLSIPASPES